MLKIEKLAEEDIESVVELSREQFGAKGWQSELFRGQLGRDGHYAYVAKLDGVVVAFVFMMKTWGEKGEDFNILNVATKKGFENMGIGTELFAFLMKFAHSIAIPRLWLEVRETNYNAIKFYTNLGFEKRYVRKNYYADGESAIVMELEL